jgi:hypothetical protein
VHLVRRTQQERFPSRTLKGDTGGDHESHQPNLGSFVTLDLTRRASEPLVVAVIESVEHNGEQSLFLTRVGQRATLPDLR